MDLGKLKDDWQADPCLRLLGFDTVEELAEHLVKCHKYLMGPNGGPFGYLYQQQTRRLRELGEQDGRGNGQQQAGRGHALRGRR